MDWTKEEGIADEEVRERILKAVETRAADRTANIGAEVMRYVEKAILLQTLDHDWREHIVNLDHLRQYVGLRGYGQRDPLNEYKSEAFELFEALLAKLRTEVVRQLMHVQISTGAAAAAGADAAARHAGHPHQSADRRGRGGAGRPVARRCCRSTPTIPGPGARSSAMRPARAARAASTSTATARCWRNSSQLALQSAFARYSGLRSRGISCSQNISPAARPCGWICAIPPTTISARPAPIYGLDIPPRAQLEEIEFSSRLQYEDGVFTISVPVTPP